MAPESASVMLASSILSIGSIAAHSETKRRKELWQKPTVVGEKCKHTSAKSALRFAS